MGHPVYESAEIKLQIISHEKIKCVTYGLEYAARLVRTPIELGLGKLKLKWKTREVSRI